MQTAPRTLVRISKAGLVVNRIGLFLPELRLATIMICLYVEAVITWSEGYISTAYTYICICIASADRDECR